MVSNNENLKNMINDVSYINNEFKESLKKFIIGIMPWIEKEYQEGYKVNNSKNNNVSDYGIRTMTLSRRFPFISQKSHAEKSEHISALRNIKSYYKSLMKTLFIEKYRSFITQGNKISKNNNTYSLMRTMIN